MSIGLDALAVNPCSGWWLHACSVASNSLVEGGKTHCLWRGSKIKRDTASSAYRSASPVADSQRALGKECECSSVSSSPWSKGSPSSEWVLLVYTVWEGRQREEHHVQALGCGRGWGCAITATEEPVPISWARWAVSLLFPLWARGLQRGCLAWQGVLGSVRCWQQGQPGSGALK